MASGSRRWGSTAAAATETAVAARAVALLRAAPTAARTGSLLGAAALAAAAVAACTEPPGDPIDALEIAITAADYQWHVRYPGRDGRLGTADDVEGLKDLHLPVGAAVTLHLTSRDFIYNYAIPDHKVRQMAIPDLDFKARLTPSAEGRFPLLGDQQCGYGHPSLLGEVIVTTPGRFLAFEHGLPPAPASEAR